MEKAFLTNARNDGMIYIQFAYCFYGKFVKGVKTPLTKINFCLPYR